MQSVLAVIMESGDLTRLYTALSLLVSTAAEGEPARGLASFGALPALLRSESFDRPLAELWATTSELHVPIHACSAAGDPGPFPVMSMPRFLKETAGARLVVV